MSAFDIIKRLELDMATMERWSILRQDMQDARNCIVGLLAENEALEQRLELLAEMREQHE